VDQPYLSQKKNQGYNLLWIRGMSHQVLLMVKSPTVDAEKIPVVDG
jgi:hypothetical protein